MNADPVNDSSWFSVVVLKRHVDLYFPLTSFGLFMETSEPHIQLTSSYTVVHNSNESNGEILM